MKEGAQVAFIPLKRRSASCWKACVARTALLSCAARKGSIRTWTTVGRRSSWRRARNGSPGDTAREATSDEVKELKAEARQLKQTLAEVLIENRLLKRAFSGDPPPLKRSDLRYVFDIKEDCNGKEALQARRDRREAAPGRCSSLAGPGHDGGDPADRCERGDLLSLASRVWRAED